MQLLQLLWILCEMSIVEEMWNQQDLFCLQFKGVLEYPDFAKAEILHSSTMTLTVKTKMKELSNCIKHRYVQLKQLHLLRPRPTICSNRTNPQIDL